MYAAIECPWDGAPADPARLPIRAAGFRDGVYRFDMGEGGG
jgi:hypothetical protein